MSKAQPQKPANPQNGQAVPQCMNKKQAKLVCLNPNCSDHPFFCTSCDNDQCEIAHHHGDKLMSVSFKEYVKRVLKDKPLDEELQAALNRYAQCLQKLKKDVEQFVEKEMTELQQIKRKLQQMGEDEQLVIQKLRKKQYTQLSGSKLDKLWQKVSQLEKKDNKDTIQFLSIKQQQIKQISDNFEKVNKMQLQDFTQQQGENDKANVSKNESKMSKNNGSAGGNKPNQAKKQSGSSLSNANKNSSGGGTSSAAKKK